MGGSESESTDAVSSSWEHPAWMARRQLWLRDRKHVGAGRSKASTACDSPSQYGTEDPKPCLHTWKNVCTHMLMAEGETCFMRPNAKSGNKEINAIHQIYNSDQKSSSYISAFLWQRFTHCGLTKERRQRAIFGSQFQLKLFSLYFNPYNWSCCCCFKRE